jgi:hypothetical protein
VLRDPTDDAAVDAFIEQNREAVESGPRPTERVAPAAVFSVERAGPQAYRARHDLDPRHRPPRPEHLE